MKNRQTLSAVLLTMIIVGLAYLSFRHWPEEASIESPAGPLGQAATAEASTLARLAKPVALPATAPETAGKPARSSPLVPGSRAIPRQTPARGAMSLASVRFAESTLKSVVKDINLTEVRVVAKRDQVFPGILDQAVVDIETGEGQMARLNGYVHQLQAVDKRQDTDFVSVTIRFVDEDPKKLEDLSRFIARFRAGKR